MQKIIIEKGRVKGKIKAPPSKSYTHRALILASLAKGKSKIFNPLISDDTKATLEILRELGIKIRMRKKFWEVEGGQFREPKKVLFCRESGTTFRLMTAISSLVKGRCHLTGEKSLLRRPIQPLLKSLSRLGVRCKMEKELVVIENNLIGGETNLPGNISSQFVSALLLISPLAKNEVRIRLTTPLESKPYLLMTIEAQRIFGVKIRYSRDLRNFWIKRQNYKPKNYFVEGDWSSVAPFLAAGAIAGKIEVSGLNLESLQADKEILKILRKMGAKVKTKGNSVMVQKSELEPIRIDVRDFPDLFPIICVLAARAKGESKISGIERLKVKESDRLLEMRKGLLKMGIKNYLKGGKFFIEGLQPKGAEIFSDDHRIVMAFSVLGLGAEGKTIIKNPKCVSKSFPEFFNLFKKLIIKNNVK